VSYRHVDRPGLSEVLSDGFFGGLWDHFPHSLDCCFDSSGDYVKPNAGKLLIVTVFQENLFA
jgi:hypothetical protein